MRMPTIRPKSPRGKYLDDKEFEETQPLLAIMILSIIVG
jgi:hypothetical protein